MTESPAATAHVYTIPADIPFAQALVAGLMARPDVLGDPMALARMTILLPTRRAVRSVGEQFAAWADARGAGAVMLPKLRPIGDLEEEDLIFDADPGGDIETLGDFDIPPAIPGLRRQFVLARLIARWAEHNGARGAALSADPAHALRLAADLGRFLDSLHIEGVDPTALRDIVPDAFADHWRENLEFLKIISEAWPAIRAELGGLDGADRRNRLIDGLAARWTAAPRAEPVIAAGSTGSIKATARLLSVIARMPQGAVILPGLDLDTDDSVWQAINPVHPQYGLKELLARMDVAREDVALWPGVATYDPAAGRARRRLIGEALRPASSTDGWRDAVQRFHDEDWSRGLDGLTLIEAADPAEEALAIAMVLREAVSRAGTTAALVTLDRSLARRVAAAMKRWDIAVDDSAGAPLAHTPPGSLLRLAAETWREELAPIPLLGLLKHPLCRCGRPRAEMRDLVGALETACLRGPRPGAGLAGLHSAFAASVRRRGAGLPGRVARAVEALLADLETAFAPLETLRSRKPVALADLVAAHIQCAERLSAVADDGHERPLWAGEAGEAAALLMNQLLDCAGDAAAIACTTYPALFDALLAGRVVRPRTGRHSRIFIWGPLEARLQHADTVVLGGLNEGTWPAELRTDPWLSRPMRAKLGMSSPERRIGLSAHDFAQLAHAPCVVMTRAMRAEGSPTVPSRWVMRLKTILDGAGAADVLTGRAPYLGWARALDPALAYAPLDPPLPTPPVAVRPRTFSVTEIDTWIRDPYAIYARKILDLEPLDPIDADAGALDRGILIHHILDRFIAAHLDSDLTDADNALAALLATGDAAFAEYDDRPRVRAFWWPRFVRIARWFIEREKAWRAEARPVATERKGVMTLDVAGGRFELKARIDRIDRLADGYAITDYKTGQAPGKKEAAAGFASQLPLEALMLQSGGVDGVAPSPVAQLLYVRVSGASTPGEIKPIARNLAETRALVTKTEQGLRRWIAAFDDARMPYASRPRPQFLDSYGAYDHLARVKEWTAAESGGDS